MEEAKERNSRASAAAAIANVSERPSRSPRRDGPRGDDTAAAPSQGLKDLIKIMERQQEQNALMFQRQQEQNSNMMQIMTQIIAQNAEPKPPAPAPQVVVQHVQPKKLKQIPNEIVQEFEKLGRAFKRDILK
jgi:hypothetical protein